MAPSVRFCSNCGAAAADPEVTRLARLQSRALEYGGDQDLGWHATTDGIEHGVRLLVGTSLSDQVSAKPLALLSGDLLSGAEADLDQ